MMEPLFPGKSEVDELNKIFKLLGTPSEKIWPGYKELPGVRSMKFIDFPVSKLREKFPERMLSDHGLDLMKGLLTYDPRQRTTCSKALEHPWFDENPRPIDPAFFAPGSCSDLAGHVGNIDGSIGRGFSSNHGCSSAFEHVVRCLGS